MEETVVGLGHHGTSVLAESAHFEGGPYGVAGEEFVVGRDACELHHAELHHEVVDEFLCLALGEGALLQVALDVDVEERRHAAHRHGRTVLCLHGSQVTEIEPLHGLAGISGRL